MVPGSSWPSVQVRAMALAAAVGVFFVAVWWSMECSNTTVQRRWQRGKGGQDPEHVQVEARHRVERLESALGAWGETELQLYRV